MFLPKGSPAEAASKINSEVKKALSAKEVSDFYSREGLDPVGSTAGELTAKLKAEIVKYAKVIRDGNIRMR